MSFEEWLESEATKEFRGLLEFDLKAKELAKAAWLASREAVEQGVQLGRLLPKGRKMSVDTYRFKYLDTVKKVILERRGEDGLSAWSSYKWGSHWYVGLQEILDGCKSERDAEIKLHYLFSLSESKDAMARSVLEHLFTGRENGI